MKIQKLSLIQRLRIPIDKFDPMKVSKQQDEETGTYFLEENDQKIAQLQYTVGPNRIIINHTEVAPEFKGQGLAQQLMQEAISDARKNKFSIVPACQFARGYFARNTESQDVL